MKREKYPYMSFALLLQTLKSPGVKLMESDSAFMTHYKNKSQKSTAETALVFRHSGAVSGLEIHTTLSFKSLVANQPRYR